MGSVKTIEALGGILEQTDIDPYDGILTSVYWFNVNETIDTVSYTHLRAHET